MTFGQRVKQYRELKEMSQAELAKKAGYTSSSTISKIESGNRDVPQSTIAALAKALGVKPSALLFDSVDEEHSIDDMEKEILWDSYKQLSDTDKRMVFLMIQRLLGVKFEDR